MSDTFRSPYSGGDARETASAHDGLTHGNCKLTAETCEAIREAVLAGAKPERAAATCGIARRTWRDWIERAEEGREPYESRMERIMLAEGVALAEAEQRIRAAGHGGDWKADAWALERRLRGEYGAKVEVTAKTADVDPDDLSDEDLARIAAASEARKTPNGDDPQRGG